MNPFIFSILLDRTSIQVLHVVLTLRFCFLFILLFYGHKIIFYLFLLLETIYAILMSFSKFFF